MPRVTLTPLSDPQVRGLRAADVRYDVRDGFARGLIIAVLPSGRKQWALRYRCQGRMRRLVLGDFPALSLSKAREAAERARVRLRDGHDLVAERQAAMARPTDTVAVLVEEYLREHARKRKRSAAEDERILEKDVLPYWRNRSVRELTRRDVRAVIERVEKRGAPIMANRTLEIMRKMLNFGVRRDWLEANPAAQIDKPGVERSRDRVLSDDEIRSLWALLERFPATSEKQAPGRKRAKRSSSGDFCPVSPALAAVQKLRLILAQRGGEIIHMRWQDLDLEAGWWTIPAEYTKNREPHRVPLPATAVELIEAQPKPDDALFVFTGRQGALVEDRVRKAGSALSRVLGFDFRSHDLRRTAATRMAAAGVPREHISRVLNHIEGGPRSTRVYDRYSYDAEKRRALEVWARDLKRIIEQQTGADVVELRRA